MVKYLRFKTVVGIAPELARRRRNLMTGIVVIVVVPSLISAFNMVKDNNFERNVERFVQENRFLGRSYVYDYRIFNDRGRKVELTVAGEPLTPEQQSVLSLSARAHKIKDGQLLVKEHSLGMTGDEMNNLIRGIYSKTDQEISRKEEELRKLTSRLDSLERLVESLVLDPEGEP